MYLRWALAMIALTLACKHYAPRTTADITAIVTMEAVKAQLARYTR
jgi:hypothetical protein